MIEVMTCDVYDSECFLYVAGPLYTPLYLCVLMTYVFFCAGFCLHDTVPTMQRFACG